MAKLLSEKQVMAIMQKLDNGYYDQKKSGYPPFALTPWDDRNRYREYVEKTLLKMEEP